MSILEINIAVFPNLLYSQLRDGPSGMEIFAIK
jgi:hypothetical protein